MILSAKIVILS